MTVYLVETESPHQSNSISVTISKMIFVGELVKNKPHEWSLISFRGI